MKKRKKKEKKMNDEIVFTIMPPKGKEFRQCKLCDMPMVYDGTSDNCLYCEITKED